MPLRQTRCAARLLAAALAILTLAPAALRAQQAAPPTRPTSTPYSGDLSIFDDPARAQKLQVERVMDTLNLHPGSVVADIGAGGGWFTVRAARRVAPGGKVIAEDINQHAIETIQARALQEHVANVTSILGTPDDPRLDPNSIDAAVMLRVYHEVAHPAVMLAHLVGAMKPGSLFAVIDHPGHGDDHGINADVVRAEVTRAGLHFVQQYDFTKGDQNDYLLLFRKP